MDENPYKAPQTEGTRGASFPWQALAFVAGFLAVWIVILTRWEWVRF